MTNPFQQLAATMLESKNLDTVLPGSGYLDEGAHDVTVQAVDSTGIADNKLAVTFADDKGRTHTERYFVTNRDGTEFSLGIRQFWAGLIPDKEAIGQFLEIAKTDDHAFEMFTGMKLQINLQRGAGFIVKSNALGNFAAYEVDKRGNVSESPLEGTEYEQVDECREAANALGFKRSYLNVRGGQAINAEANIEAFKKAVADRAKGGSPKITKVV